MGFFDKIRSGLQKTKANIGETLDSVLSVFRKVDEETLEELEDALILSDIGAQTAAETIDELRERAKRQSIESKEELVEALCQILTEKMTPNDGLHLNTHPSVILVIGVNGVGKTTTCLLYTSQSGTTVKTMNTAASKAVVTVNGTVGTMSVSGSDKIGRAHV